MSVFGRMMDEADEKIRQLEADRDRLAGEVARMRELFDKYSSHLHSCEIDPAIDAPCTCGLDKATEPPAAEGKASSVIDPVAGRDASNGPRIDGKGITTGPMTDFSNDEASAPKAGEGER